MLTFKMVKKIKGYCLESGKYIRFKIQNLYKKLSKNRKIPGAENKKSNNKAILITAFAIMIITFLISRLPFFLHYPVPHIANDSPKYYRMVETMNQGKWPKFQIITPGYPLFIKLIYTFSERVSSIILVQNCLTLCSSLLLIFSLYLLRPLLAILSAIAMAIFISGGTQLIFDCAYRPDSLYVNFIILSFAFFILALTTNKKIYYILTSIAMATVIIIRPAGMFLIIIFILVNIYFLINHFPRKIILPFFIPFVLLLLSLCIYNVFTLKAFTISPFGARNFIMTTLFYAEPSPEYSSKINTALEIIHERYLAEDKAVIAHSWNLSKIQKILQRYWNINRVFCNQVMKLNKRNYMNAKPIFSKIRKDALRKHPEIFVKIFVSNLYFYFFKNMNSDRSFYRHLNQSYMRVFMQKDIRQLHHPLPDKLKRGLLKELYNPEPLPWFKHPENESATTELIPTPIQKTHQSLINIRKLFFRNIFWPLGYIAALCFSLVVLIRKRFHHHGAFVVLAITLSALGAALIICLASRPIPRYSYITEFIYYLSLPLLLLLKFPRFGKQAETGG